MREAASPANSGVIYALVFLVLALTILSDAKGLPSYLSPINVSNVFDQVALVGMLAVFTTVVLISGNFDISIAAIGGLGAAITLLLVDELGVAGAVLAAIAATSAVGLFNGFCVQKLGINAFIVTLGTLTAVRGLILVITDGRTVIADDPANYKRLESFVDGFVPAPALVGLIGIALIAVSAVQYLLTRRYQGQVGRNRLLLAASGAVVLLVGLSGFPPVRLTYSTLYLFGLVGTVWIVLRYTIVGRRLQAVGGNPEAARLSGISVDRYRIVPFVLNGSVAGLVGVIYSARLGAVDPSALHGFELTAIAAAILGGTSLFGGQGSVPKAILGALILIVLRNGFNMLNLGSNYQQLVEGIVIVAAAAVYVIAARSASQGGGH